MQNDIHGMVFTTARKRSNYERTYKGSSLLKNSSFNWIETRANKTARIHLLKTQSPAPQKRLRNLYESKSPTTYLKWKTIFDLLSNLFTLSKSTLILKDWTCLCFYLQPIFLILRLIICILTQPVFSLYVNQIKSYKEFNFFNFSTLSRCNSLVFCFRFNQFSFTWVRGVHFNIL